MSDQNQQQNAAAMEDPMAAFYTRDAANEGTKATLYSPTGLKTDQWLMLRSIDSDAYRLAELAQQRENMKLAQLKTDEERNQAIIVNTRKLIAHLVMGWSFDKPCTHENVVAFLQNAPQIETMVEKIAGDRQLFFALRSSDSALTPKPSSSST